MTLPQTALEWIGQILSIAGMVLTILSLQCKSVFRFYAVQILSNLSFMASFFLLGEIAGGMFNLFGFARALVLFGGDRFHNTPVLVALLAGATGCGVLSYITDGWIALLPFVAQLIGTVGMWSRNGQKLRIAQFCAVSPLWLTYNIIVGAFGGIGCETFNMVSVIVSVCRHGWRALGVTESKGSVKNAQTEESTENAKIG